MWEGNGNPLQYVAWEIPWTEESGWAIVHGVGSQESDITKSPPPYIHTYIYIIYIYIYNIM